LEQISIYNCIFYTYLGLTPMELVEATGFDALDAGSLEDSWRQQPGNPAYCTELTIDQLRFALMMADRSRAPRRRDVVSEAIETFGEGWTNDDLVRLNRAITRSHHHQTAK
jgi:8-hydroxy-5-deazaflavin:NADPH oxidoreductase